MSGNLNADVETQREYFNASYFNKSGRNQAAKYETRLLKPFFNDPDKWVLAINRMRVPLSGIPLTRNNIPFEQWQVGLSFQRSGGLNFLSDFEYVKQFNRQTKTGTFYFNYTPDNRIEKIDSNLQNYFVVSSVQLSNVITTNNGKFIRPAFDYYNNTGTCYVLKNDGLTVQAYNPNNGTLIQEFTVSYPVKGISSDADGNLFISYFDFNAGNPNVLSYYKRNSYVSWNIPVIYSLSGSANTPAINDTASCAVVNSTIFLAIHSDGPNPTQGWQIVIASVTSNSFNNFAGDPSITNFGNFKANPPDILGSLPNNIFQIYSMYTTGNVLYSWNTQLVASYSPITVVNNVAIGYDNIGRYIMNGSWISNNTGYQVITSASQSYYFTPTNGSISLFPTSATYTVDIDSGRYDIFTYQDFLNQINTAFSTAFANIKAVMGSAFNPTQPPEIVYDATNKLFSLIIEGQYLQKNDDGTNTYNIYLNDNLWNKFYFPSINATVNNVVYKSIMLQNYGINAIQGNGSATLPQFIYVRQEDSTIYAFYDLVRIIVGTNQIPVSGDGEGKTFSDNGLPSNNAINMITDIVPDTTTLTPGGVLIYIPSGILRWYNLYAQQPFSKIDLFLQYETKDGNIYPIEIINNEFFSVKLEFKKSTNGDPF